MPCRAYVSRPASFRYQYLFHAAIAVRNWR